jgi:hypothetical protein
MTETIYTEKNKLEFYNYSFISLDVSRSYEFLYFGNKDGGISG